ncbi:histidine kinase [uncultured Cohaesibacter sp.]|uniref:histidine kinase n=1 Tax=uncultured Cohaesibacter sp. TaxID=1002546 RepID=UPI0029C88907|nr:histidine kinase [uncultured Cohaesibacter sp.]
MSGHHKTIAETEIKDCSMPSLIKALVFLLVLGGLVAGGIFALANFVEPTQREMVVRIPAKTIN